MEMRYPGDSERVTIIGKTGSGKTQAAGWLLSHRSYDTRPWIIFDFKYDQLLNDIRGTKEIDVNAKIPTEPGLYIVHPRPGQEEEVEAMFWRIWEREGVGVYIDEGYMIPSRSSAFQAILTQGRSKEIPVMMLTQRPVYVSRFCLSEAEYIMLFSLTDERDLKTVKQFMPMPIHKPLPEYHAYWWDNVQNLKAVLKPVPDRNTILQTFRDRLGTRRRFL